MPSAELVRRRFPDRTGRDTSGLGVGSEKLKVLEYDSNLARIDVVLDQFGKNGLLCLSAERALVVEPVGNHDRCVGIADEWLALLERTR